VSFHMIGEFVHFRFVPLMNKHTEEFVYLSSAHNFIFGKDEIKVEYTLSKSYCSTEAVLASYPQSILQYILYNRSSISVLTTVNLTVLYCRSSIGKYYSTVV
jgi:hypothetical protein